MLQHSKVDDLSRYKLSASTVENNWYITTSSCVIYFTIKNNSILGYTRPLCSHNQAIFRILTFVNDTGLGPSSLHLLYYSHTSVLSVVLTEQAHSCLGLGAISITYNSILPALVE